MTNLQEIENFLKKEYLPIMQNMMGLKPHQAKKTFKELWISVKNNAEKEGTLDFPAMMGNTLLEKENSDTELKKAFAKIRNHGVRDDDIRWWWNMHDLQRRMMRKLDEVFIYSLFLNFTKNEGLSDNEANLKIRKIRPLFGDPDDLRFGKPADRPLPDELRKRVNDYIIQRGNKDPEGLKQDVAACSSFNAFIRKLIRAGNL